MFIIFKKLSDDDNVILRSDEDDDLEDLTIQKKFESNFEKLSQSISNKES